MFGFGEVHDSIKMAREQFAMTMQTAGDVIKLARDICPITVDRLVGSQLEGPVVADPVIIGGVLSSNKKLSEQTRLMARIVVHTEDKRAVK